MTHATEPASPATEIAVPFDMPVAAENHAALARELIEIVTGLAEASYFQLRADRGGVRVETRDARVVRHGSSPTTTQVARVTFDVGAKRADAFALLSDPARGHEWDPLDRGHETIEAYADGDLVARTWTQPPWPMARRENLLHLVRREAYRPDTSVACARAVSHRDAKEGAVPRIRQQIFGWVLRDRAPSGTVATAIVSVPENLFPAWLMRLSTVPGWRSIATRIRARLA